MPTISPLSGPERLRAAMAAAALRANAAASSVTTPAAPRQPDAVTISDKARSFINASKAVADAPDVREDRVSALKASIAAGTYAIDSRRLASKIATSIGL
jgi:negative regulator of flagellin synthesis FlgM